VKANSKLPEEIRPVFEGFEGIQQNDLDNVSYTFSPKTSAHHPEESYDVSYRSY
jgi:hypothetical protein